MRDEQAKAKAATARAEAEVSRARDEIQRSESTYKMLHLASTRLSDVSKQRPGLVAQQEVDDAESRDLSAASQVSGSKANLEAALEALNGAKQEQARLSTLYEYTKVIAPFSGVITKRFANTGSMIQAGTASQTQAMPVVRLSENSLLRLILPVPESAVPTVHIGEQVDVRVPTLKRTFPGKVARFSDKVTTETRTMDTEVDVPNPNLLLIPGMYAEVDLTTERDNRVIAIPITALDRDSDTAGHVTVVTPANRVEIRKVTVGIETADMVEIRSGLIEGDAVVTSNRTGLEAGQAVQPRAN
jgi:RND family efflux transporter MFP subunit